MAALTDKQKVIYNFLKSKPGYLKKSATNIPVKGSLKDIQVALDKAKAFFKKKPLVVIGKPMRGNSKAVKSAEVADFVRAKKFNDRASSDDDKRMISIMKNIIKNKGTFKP